MDNHDEDDDIGARLASIRAAQQHCGQDSDSDNDSSSREAASIVLQCNDGGSNLSQVHGLSQQGFSQDLSQSTQSMPVLTGGEYQNDPWCPFAPGGHLAKRPPLPPSRAQSPAVSTTSATTSATKKKLSTKKTDAEKVEEAKLQQDIEAVVAGFKPEYKDYIQCVDERDIKSLEDKEFYSVAKWLKVNKPTKRTLDLATFNSKQIRRLAQNCGVKGGGNLTLFQARRHIALAINMGTVYNDDTIANPRTTVLERKVNTLMRVTNACFHPDMKDRFIDLNDTKKRADYEKAHGGNPVKDFWILVSDMTNDSTQNDVLGIVLESRAGEDQRLHDFVQIGAFNLNDWTTQTYLSCQQNMNDLMKARENCLKQMRTSGHHSNDMWTYAINPKWTKLRKSSAELPAKAVYYCHVLCTKHPDIDGKFAPFLSEALKSDSSVDLTGEAGVSQESTAGSSKRKAAAMDNLVQSLSTAAVAMTTSIEEKKKQQKKTADTVEDDGDERVRALWQEYFTVSEKFLELKEQPQKVALLRNMSIRVRGLEKVLKIEESVTAGVEGLAPMGVITVVTAKDSTSEITSQDK
jgi:hypothetical protein